MTHTPDHKHHQNADENHGECCQNHSCSDNSLDNSPSPDSEKTPCCDASHNAQNTTETVPAEPNTESSEPQDPLAKLEALLLAEQAKTDANWQLYLSAKADADNIQKRAQRDVENAYKFALERFIPELLAVKDSLEMGVQAAKTSEAADLASFIEGSEMSLKVFADALEKQGVELIAPSEGELLNPDLHQAMMMQDSNSHPANSILSVMQKGYRLNGRLLRPALVIVAKSA